MSDITGYQSGVASTSGKVNWRGDQATVPISQSIYKTSSVQLADLGSRIVVGDRSFRYAKLNGAVQAGDVVEMALSSQILVTAGGTNAAGGKVFTFYFATTNGKDVYAEGTLFAQSGTAANMGYSYRVKTQPAVATTSNANLVLYDELVKAANVTDKWSLLSNPYMNVIQCSAGAEPIAGVAAVSGTAGDFVWLQTWGPTAVKCGAGAVAGMAVIPDVTGQVLGLVQATTVGVKAVIGQSMAIFTASQRGPVFLTIAP